MIVAKAACRCSTSAGADELKEELHQARLPQGAFMRVLRRNPPICIRKIRQFVHQRR